MIKDIRQFGLFHTDMMRVVLDLPHKEISDNALEWIAKTDRYTTYHDNKLNQEWFSQMPAGDKFVDDVYESSQKYLQSTGRRPFKDRNDFFVVAWVSAYGEHDQHGSHNHPNSLISGTYYPQVPKGASPIVYDSPCAGLMMHDTKQEVNHTYPPSTGDMMLWPSWLFHRVHMPSGPVTEQRIAISFNVDYKRYHI